MFNLMDNYGGGMSVMWIAITEMIGIMWFYGANNFAKVQAVLFSHLAVNAANKI